MRRLPPLPAGAGRWALPMADSSAGALAELLLAGDAARRRDTLAEVLAADPPLLIWAVWTGWETLGLQPRSVCDVADWLAGSLSAVLRWEQSEPFGAAPFEDQAPAARSSSCDPRALECGDRVAAALTLARLAAALAAKEGATAVDQALLLGLLDDVRGWLAASVDLGERAAGVEAPNWPLQFDRSMTAAAEVVRFARAVLRGEEAVPNSVEVDLAVIAQEAEKERRRWLAEGNGLAAWLPQLAHRLARLTELEGKFHEALEREKLEAMAEFAAGAGHEINNPLTVIAGRAQLFLREETDPERRRALALISAQAMRVYEMIADMMLFARPPRPELQPVDLVKLVDDLAADLQLERGAGPICRDQPSVGARPTNLRPVPGAAHKLDLSSFLPGETTIRRSGAPGPIIVRVDPVQLHVALRAICQNALESLQKKGSGVISLRVNPQGSEEEAGPDKRLPTPFSREVHIRISDDGPGITTEQRRHIFDPFYSARQAGRGLGLGLSKAWRIVTNHGGRIEVSSEPGRGTSFLIALPMGD